MSTLQQIRLLCHATAVAWYVSELCVNRDGTVQNGAQSVIMPPTRCMLLIRGSGAWQHTLQRPCHALALHAVNSAKERGGVHPAIEPNAATCKPQAMLATNAAEQRNNTQCTKNLTPAKSCIAQQGSLQPTNSNRSATALWSGTKMQQAAQHRSKLR